MAPASLKEIEPIRFAFVVKSVRRGERGSHALTGKHCESRGHGPIKKIQARTAVEQIELVSRSRLNTQAAVGEEHTALEIISGANGGDGLRGPLSRRGEE